MANSHSPSSSQEPPDSIAAQPQASKPASRRLPPPCWSNEETVALIDAYRDKWYSLRRGNLRASHWQDVAGGVSVRCPLGNPPKTSIQCRHKMEKLRKRYRAEIQRISNNPRGHRYPSAWVHFKRMDAMELGSSSSDPSVDRSNHDEDEEDGGDEDDDDLNFHEPKVIKQAIALPLNHWYQNSIGNGVRIKIPKIASALPPPPHNNNRLFDDYPPPAKPHYLYTKEASRTEKGGEMKRSADVADNGSNPMDDMAAAIHKLGDGFVKMEMMKMDMAREVESMRMKMEMKRTEMILESQQKLVDSFSETVMEKKIKKMKRMPTPES